MSPLLAPVPRRVPFKLLADKRPVPPFEPPADEWPPAPSPPLFARPRRPRSPTRPPAPLTLPLAPFDLLFPYSFDAPAERTRSAPIKRPRAPPEPPFPPRFAADELPPAYSSPGRSRPPPPLSRLLSDLVLDSKLEATNLRSCIRHTFIRPGHAAGERFIRVEERWAREATLGEGAHGVVYRERLEGSGRIRAIKEIRKSICAELDYSRELEAIVKFSHPKYAHCFVSSNGWFELGDSIFISMEYLELGDLEKHIARPLAEIEARQISSQVLEGLVYMHENYFVHRDLKPGNIMVVAKQPKWFVKIADFGVSKRRLPGVTFQHTSNWLSFNYAAPEQLDLGSCADEVPTSPFAMDIWSFGAVAYRILTATVPFRLSALAAYAEGRCGFPYDPLRRFYVSESAAKFLAATMSASPGSRPLASTARKHDWFREVLPEVIYNRNSDGLLSDLSDKNLTSASNASAAWSTASVARGAGNATTKRPFQPATLAPSDRVDEWPGKDGTSLGNFDEMGQPPEHKSFGDTSSLTGASATSNKAFSDQPRTRGRKREQGVPTLKHWGQPDLAFKLLRYASETANNNKNTDVAATFRRRSPMITPF